MSGMEIAKALPMEMWDKFLHFIAFAVGAALLALALRLSSAWSWKKIAPAAIVVISAYGALDEWHQHFTPGRLGNDPGDWIADTLGAAAGTLVIAYLYARYSRTPRLAPAGA